jgi:hypothetical protein
LLHDNSLIDNCDIATEILCLLEIVSGEDDCDSRLIQLPEKIIHPESELEIYSGGRLIEDEKVWIMDECSGNHQSSLHTSRESTRCNIPLFPESEGFEVLFNIGPGLFWTDPIVPCLSEDDVIDFFEYSKIELLRYDPDTHTGLGSSGIEIMIPDDHFSVCLVDETRDDPDCSGFASSVGPEKCEKISFFYRKCNSF